MVPKISSSGTNMPWQRKDKEQLPDALWRPKSGYYNGGREKVGSYVCDGELYLGKLSGQVMNCITMHTLKENMWNEQS